MHFAPPRLGRRSHRKHAGVLPVSTAPARVSSGGCRLNTSVIFSRDLAAVVMGALSAHDWSYNIICVDSPTFVRPPCAYLKLIYVEHLPRLTLARMMGAAMPSPRTDPKTVTKKGRSWSAWRLISDCMNCRTWLILVGMILSMEVPSCSMCSVVFVLIYV